MNVERNRGLLLQHVHEVATSARASSCSAVRRTASQLRPTSRPHDRSARSSRGSQVPSIRSCLCSSSRRSCSGRVGSAACSGGLVRSQCVVRVVIAVRAVAPPNKLLVPTPVTSAPSLSSYRGAAHLRR
jgi:hypothetical protein